MINNTLKLVLSTLLILLFTACQPEGNSKKDLKTGEFEKKEIPTCDCIDLNKDSMDVSFLDTIPFTGRCLSYYPNSEKIMEEKSYLKGRLHGNYLVRDMNTDKVISSVKYIDGYMENDNLNKNNICNCNDLTYKDNKQKKLTTWFLKKRPYDGVCYLYGKDSTVVIMEKHFKKGLVDGEMMIYDNEGKVIQLDLYKQGRLIKTKFFTE